MVKPSSVMLEESHHPDSVNDHSTVVVATAPEGHDLNTVFQKLEVECQCNLDDLPASHNQVEYPCSGPIFGNSQQTRRKMNSRSPDKDSRSERVVKGSNRSKPYAVPDFSFGEALDQLTLKSEQCLNPRCLCNSQPSAGPQSSQDSLNFVHACQSKKVFSKKIVQDAKLKLHHRKKDHNGVLRAAKLKLHTLNGEWYKNVPRKGTVQRKSIFGETSTSDKSNTKGFNTLSKENACDNVPLSGQLFKEYRKRELVVDKQKEPDNGQEDSLNPCTCSVQARLQTDYSVEELAGYLDEFLYLPKEMSPMAEMMYT